MALANLLDFFFTPSADTAFSGTGWKITTSTSIDTQGGDDDVEGISGNEAPGILLEANSSLNMSSGNDRIFSISAGGDGVRNEGRLFTSDDDDSIFGAGHFGLFNIGIINTGRGNDEITGTSISPFGGGIANSGTINTGPGRDTIVGTGTVLIPAIINDGLIDTGGGRDIVNGQNGGFWGSGTVSLGSGADTLIGICTNGTISFQGDDGRDRILLENNVSVTIAKNSDGSFSITTPLVVRPDGSYRNFELIGGLNSGICIELRPGTLSIDGFGIPSYV